MALLRLAAMGLLCVAAEDAVTDLTRRSQSESQFLTLSSHLVSPTKEWLCVFSLNYEQSPLPGAV